MGLSNKEASGWTMAEIVRKGAREYPERSALTFEARSLTYRELDSRASRVANGLAAWDVGLQARVAFLDFSTSCYFEVFFGSAKADCTLVGVNARLAAPEVLYILNDSQTVVLFVGREHYALVEKIAPELKTVRHIIAVDGGHARWPDYATWRDSHSGADPVTPLHEDSDVIQLYTSGTTGLPKGVCHTNRTWGAFSRARSLVEWADYGPQTVTFVCMPLFHVAGFNLTCLTLLGGGQALISRKFDPEEILDFIPRYRITDTLWVPAMILALVSHPRASDCDFSSLNRVSYGAAPIPEALLKSAQALLGCGFVHLYGLTENLGAATYLPPDMHHSGSGKLKSCGRVYDGLELKIVDRSGRSLPPREVGEIIVRCPWIMRGYWRNPAGTQEAVRDGWLHTGDAGYLDEDGYLYIHDRVKDMIISGGENVYPAEVENALFGHPAVADVAVIGVPDAKWGEAVKAIVVLKPGERLDVADLIRYARERIAGYKVPKSVEVIDALPRNASGKVLRRELREPYWKGHARQVN